MQLTLSIAYAKTRKKRAEEVAPFMDLANAPKVTMQLPMYNELYVAERIIETVAAFEYPADKFEIQVLDDSTDETKDVIAKKVAEVAAITAIAEVAVELKVVEPVVYKVTSAPAEGVLAQGLHLVGLKMITESSLTEDQKKLAASIYDSVKAAIKEFISDPSINETIKITKTLGKLIKELENATVDGKAPSGADKKAVAIQLGRILIKEVITSDSLEANILMVYDVVAEPTLEDMIEVSKVVNVVVQKVATSCGPTFNKILKLLRLKAASQ